MNVLKWNEDWDVLHAVYDMNCMSSPLPPDPYTCVPYRVTWWICAFCHQDKIHKLSVTTTLPFTHLVLALAPFLFLSTHVRRLSLMLLSWLFRGFQLRTDSESHSQELTFVCPIHSTHTFLTICQCRRYRFKTRSVISVFFKCEWKADLGLNWAGI